MNENEKKFEMKEGKFNLLTNIPAEQLSENASSP